MFPGETLITLIWRTEPGKAVFRTEASNPGVGAVRVRRLGAKHRLARRRCSITQCSVLPLSQSRSGSGALTPVYLGDDITDEDAFDAVRGGPVQGVPILVRHNDDGAVEYA
ncbi:hypothetical protein MAHJHV59_49770 [Mycobacterium avium subsp. hominissuis]